MYLFDKRGQRLWCVISFAGNIVLTFVYLCFIVPEGAKIPVDASVIKDAMITNVACMSLFTLMTLYFNEVSNQVYEGVREANEAMERATKEKEAFFATISHEIRNPLQSLLGAVELLTDSGFAPGSAAPLLEICKNCSALVINLVSNILDMSKIAADRMQLSPVPADLREIVSRILRMTKSRAEGRNIQLRFDCDDRFPPAVLVDTQRIEQIVVNLVSNAIKFTTKGKIAVKLGWIPCEDTEEAAKRTVSAALSRSSRKQLLDFSEDIECGVNDNMCHLQSKLLKTSYASSAMTSPKAQHFTAEDLAGDYAAASQERFLIRPQPVNTFREEVKSLSAAATSGVVELEVMDTGIGIQKESLQKLFRPYQQANASISRFGTHKDNPELVGSTGEQDWDCG